MRGGAQRKCTGLGGAEVEGFLLVGGAMWGGCWGVWVVGRVEAGCVCVSAGGGGVGTRS